MPVGGIDLSKPDTFTGSDKTHDSQNCVYEDGYIRKNRGTISWGDGTGDMPFNESGSNETVLGLLEFFDLDGNIYYLAITNHTAYRYSSTADNWEVIYVFQEYTSKTITNVTAANPAVVTSTGHGYSDGDKVHILGVVGNMGTDVLNGNTFTVANKTANTYELSGTDTSGKTYTSGGTSYVSVDLNGTVDDQCRSCHIADDGTGNLDADWYLIITNGVDPIMYWAGGTEPVWQYQDTDSNTHTAKDVVNFKDSLVLLHADGEPQLVRWTDSGTADNFDTNNFLYMYDTPGKILGGAILNGNLGVAKDDALNMITFTGGGDSSAKYRYDTMVRGTGPRSLGTLATHKNFWIFFSFQGFEKWDGINTTDTLFASSIAEKIESKIVNISTGINLNYIDRTRALVDESTRRIMFHFPMGGDSYARNIISYDYTDGVWEYHTMPVNVTAVGLYKNIETNIWGDLVGSWAAQTKTWKELEAVQGYTVPSYGNDTGRTYLASDATYLQLDGSGSSTVPNQYHIFPTYVPDKNWYKNRWVRYMSLIFEVKGFGDIGIYYKNSSGTWTQIASETMTTNWQRIEAYIPTAGINSRDGIEVKITDGNDGASVGSNFECRYAGVSFIPKGLT
jgi:hypothetical protein